MTANVADTIWCHTIEQCRLFNNQTGKEIQVDDNKDNIESEENPC